MIVDPRIESYIASLDAQSDPVLAAMEALAERRRFPIVGRQAGMLLGVLTHAIAAHRVLELGSGYGYSALWFARALPPDGKVICTDFSRDNRDLALGYFRTTGLEAKMEFLVGDALALAREQRPGFDIIFVDIDKEGYPTVLDVALPLLLSGGLLITDNVLWSGRVADPAATDPATEAVRVFNKLIFSRAELESLILPIHDGIAVCRKR
jgi:predicted O-methyltransferase YrrM